MTKLNNDQVSATVWLAIGLIIVIASFSYKLGSLSSPGTGFMPFLAGLAICLFSFIILIQATQKKRSGIEWKPILKDLMWGKSMAVLTALLAYILLLNLLGFLVCTALFIGFLFRVMQPMRWSVVIAGAIAVAFAAYGIFEIMLQSPLPKGPWGF